MSTTGGGDGGSGGGDGDGGSTYDGGDSDDEAEGKPVGTTWMPQPLAPVILRVVFLLLLGMYVCLCACLHVCIMPPRPMTH